MLRLSTDLTRIADDLRESEPDYCLNVPALLERMRTAIEGQISQAAAASCTRFFAMRRRHGGVAGRIRADSRWRWLAHVIFPAIRKKLGGNLKALICGSAPLARETQLFFMMLGIPVLQVYGLTETTAICTMDDPKRVEPGTVGPAIPGIEMKLGEGEEILVRGPNIFPGYWNRPEQTAEVLAGRLVSHRRSRRADAGRQLAHHRPPEKFADSEFRP